jgi:hypothetical protein
VICYVSYVVPVTVKVDTETCEVQRVVVEDEMIDRIEDADVVDENGDELELGDPERDVAVAVAEDADWPKWEFGF